jgi:hypothetical protein
METRRLFLGTPMKTVALYQQFSRECAQLADQLAEPNAKQSLQSMEELADERAASLTREIDRHSGLTAASAAPAPTATLAAGQSRPH